MSQYYHFKILNKVNGYLISDDEDKHYKLESGGFFLPTYAFYSRYKTMHNLAFSYLGIY